MRILIVNTLYPPIVFGGAEKSVMLLAEALVKYGDDVAVVSLHPGSTTDSDVKNGVRCYRIPLYNMYWPFGQTQKISTYKRLLWHARDRWNRQAAKSVGAILDAEKPEILHTNNVTGFSVAVWEEARKRSIPILHTLRDYSLMCVRGSLFRNGADCEHQCLDCRALSSRRKTESTFVDMLIGNSKYIVSAHQKLGFFQGVPFEAIYNVAGKLSADDYIGQEDRNYLQLGYIGVVSELKGIEVLLQALSRVRNPNWKLKIAGKGIDDYVESLKLRFHDSRIEWLGFVAPRDFYTSVDLVVIPSVWPEPLPRTLIESLLYGRAAICAASGGTPEIAELGKQVRTYAPKDVGALASILEEAISNPSAWRAGGFRDENAADVFSEASVVRRYRGAYEQAMKHASVEADVRGRKLGQEPC